MTPEIVGEGPGFKMVRTATGEVVRVADGTQALAGLQPAPPPPAPVAQAPTDNAFMQWVNGAGAPAGTQPPPLSLGGVGKDIMGWASKGNPAPSSQPIQPYGFGFRDPAQGVRPERVFNHKTGSDKDVEDQAKEKAQRDSAMKAALKEGGGVGAPATGGSGAAGAPEGALQMAFTRPMGGGGQGIGLPSIRTTDPKAIGAAYEQQKRAQEQMYEAGAARAAANQGYEDEKARLAEERAVQVREQQRAQKEFFDKEMGELNKLTEDVRKPDAQIDPNRYWASKTTGQKLMAGIGVFLGGAGGGQNQALGIITKAIDNDIAAQKENIANSRQAKRDGLTAQQSYLGIARARFSDEATAEAAAYSAAYTAVQARIDAIAKRYDSQEMRAKADSAIAELETKKQEQLGVAQQMIFDNSVKRGQLHLAQQAQQADMFQALLKAKGDDKSNELLVPGYGMALDKEAAKTARSASGGFDTVKGLINQLRQHRRDHGVTVPGSAADKQVKVLETKLKLALKSGEELGTWDKGSAEILGELVPKGGGVGHVEAPLDELEKASEHAFRSRFSKYMDPRSYQSTQRPQHPLSKYSNGKAL